MKRELLFAKLIKWGGTLSVLPPTAKHRGSQWHRARGWSPAPYTAHNIGIHWDRKILYVSRDWLDKRDYPHAITRIIHEMGHLFATDRPPHLCAESDFFGWEWAVAHEIDMPTEDFRIGNSDRIVNCLHVLDLEPWEWADLVFERVNDAIENGLIKEGQARSIR